MTDAKELIREAMSDNILRSGLDELNNYNTLTYYHSIDVCKSAIELGQSYFYNDDHLLKLAKAALLHDIGKLKVPTSILCSTQSLTDESWFVIKMHPMYSATWVLENMGDQEIASIVIAHHEKLNGSGYPLGLRGSQISLDARILAIADIYQALRNKRTYKLKIWSKDEILNEFKSTKGIDIHIVEEYFKLLE